MAWSSKVLTAAETAACAADMPILLGAHALRDGVPSAFPWTETGATGDTNQALTFMPSKRAWDMFAHAGLHTAPDSNAATWYFAFALTTAQAFDCMVLHGSNLDLAEIVQLDIADNAGFTSNKQTLWQATGAATGARKVVLDLHHTGSVPLRYSGVGFLRLQIDRDPAYAPRVRELWLGRRRQLLSMPERPLDDEHEEAVVRSVTSKAGVRTNWLAERRGASRLYTITTTATELAPLALWWADCRWGSRPFYLIETPTSAPAAYLMRLTPPAFEPVNVGNGVREIQLSMREQAPFLGLE